MLILGLSAYEHGGAAAVVRDGELLAAAHEERWSRRRRDPAFPLRAARECLRLAGATSAELDLAVFHQRPLRRFERVLSQELAGFPRTCWSFAGALFTWLGDRLWVRGRIADELGIDLAKVSFCDHAVAQATASFATSPFEDAAVLFAGLAGEWTTTSLHLGRGSALTTLVEQHHPHSLADACAAAVGFLGFAADDAQHTLAELAVHGRPTEIEAVRRLFSVAEDGAVRVAHGVLPPPGAPAEREYGPAWEQLLGAARLPSGPLLLGADGRDARHADVAASVQAALEEALLALGTELHRRTSCDALCVAGELADNATAMARLLADGPFRRLHLEPSAAAGGAALGAALHAAYASGAARRTCSDPLLCLGQPVLDLDEGGERLPDSPSRIAALLETLLANGCAGRVSGRAAFAERSPGDRVVLANPGSPQAAARLRDGVLRLEPFRGLGCAVRAERAPALFELPAGADVPLAGGRLRVPARPELAERAPHAVDVGGGARPIVVSREHDAELHELLARFEEQSGVPALLCETLATRGEPPVRGALDSRGLLERTALDSVVIEDRRFAAGTGRKQ